jgi:RNA polymerase sigma-70 factor (ECF subfamily)
VELKAVIENCREGRPGAWDMLVNAFAPKVFNMAYQFTGSRAEAEDQSQEIFLKVFHNLPKYDSQKNFTAWLLTLAKNHLIDSYRRAKWEKKNRYDFDEILPFRASAADSPEETFLQREEQSVLWRGLNSLPSDVRLALILKEIQGKKYEEVAEVLGLPVGTVKSRINRGKLQLARLLRERKEEGL